MDGLITGNNARNYDKNWMIRESNKQNSFLGRVIRKDSIAADLCAGTGISTEFLLHRAKKVYAIEMSDDMLEICKSKFKKDKRVVIIKADAAKTKLPNNSVDYVLMRMALHHIKEKHRVIDETWRILKKDGQLIIMDQFAVKPKIITKIYDYFRLAINKKLDIKHFHITIGEFEQLIQDKYSINYQTSQIQYPYVRANYVLSRLKNV